MQGRGRSKPPPYTGPLRRPGMPPNSVPASKSTAEIESDLQIEELEEKFKGLTSEPTKDDSPSTPPEQISYLTPPSTPGDERTQQKLVNESIDSADRVALDDKPSTVTSFQQTSPSSTVSTDAIVSKDKEIDALSKLNPNAVEFVPSWFTQVVNEEQHSVQAESAISSSEQHSLPVEATAPPEQPEPVTVYTATPDDFAMESFNNIFAYLTQCPHDFDDAVEELKNHLEVYVNEQSTLEIIANCILKWCIHEPNFRYTGARLATYLNTHLTFDASVIPIPFMRVFMARCKQELLFCNQCNLTDEDITRIIGFSSFLGELYCVFKNKDGSPLGPLRHGILEMIELLLSNPGHEEMLIAAGKVLKLTGSLLDNATYFGDRDGPQQMADIFSRIDKICLDNTTSKRAKEFLLSVIKLRHSNWGQVEVGSPSPTAQKTPFAYPAGSAVYTPPGTLPNPGEKGATAAVAAMSVQDPEPAWSQGDSTAPVTNPDQWNEFWMPDENDNGIDDMFQYFSKPWSDMDDFEQEFKTFLIESEQLP